MWSEEGSDPRYAGSVLGSPTDVTVCNNAFAWCVYGARQRVSSAVNTQTPAFFSSWVLDTCACQKKTCGLSAYLSVYPEKQPTKPMASTG